MLSHRAIEIEIKAQSSIEQQPPSITQRQGDTHACMCRLVVGAQTYPEPKQKARDSEGADRKPGPEMRMERDRKQTTSHPKSKMKEEKKTRRPRMQRQGHKI